MRRCPECKFSKADHEFPGNGDKCSQCRSEQYKRTRDETRKAVLDLLGGRCACCGESEYVFLDLDHVDNDGYSDRRDKRGATWRLALKDPDRFQVLCRNCNWAKFRGGCPHGGLAVYMRHARRERKAQ